MNSKKTLGKNTTIDYVDYCTGTFNNKEYMFFDIGLRFCEVHHSVIIEEKSIDDPNLEPRMRIVSLSNSMPCRSHLASHWPELVSICKHERTEQKRAEEY